MSLAFRELGHTFRQMRGFRVIVIYLVSYLLFNDGVQTVLTVAGAYGADTIGIPLVFNMATILVIQFVAAFGAMAFSWLAYRLTTKVALALTLVGWSFVVLLGVGVAPLDPREHDDFDYRLGYEAQPGRLPGRRGSRTGRLQAGPDLGGGDRAYYRHDTRWRPPQRADDLASSSFDGRRECRAVGGGRAQLSRRPLHRFPGRRAP